MRLTARAVLLAALLAALLWSPLRSAEDDNGSQPQLTEQNEQRVAQRSQHLAKALGSLKDADGLGDGPKAPKVGRRLVAKGHLDKTPLDGGAPPAVMNDMAEAPEKGVIALLYGAFFKSSKTAEIVSWLSKRPTDAEQSGLNEAFEYYRSHTSAGKNLDNLMRPSIDDSDATHGRANYAAMDHAHGVTVPLPSWAKHHQGEDWSVTFNEDERQAPIEARALLIGHEIGVHAKDVSDGFINGNAGSQIPSELRAFVMDAKNYLEIRKELEENQPDRLAALRAEPVWEQADLKARVLLGKDISKYMYPGSAGAGLTKDIDFIMAKRGKTPAAWDVAVAYVDHTYEQSGEKGRENISLLDETPVGRYNSQTKEMADQLKDGAFSFMDHDY